MKTNCWEVTGCGRQPGGEQADEFGVCPASVTNEMDGRNDGEHAGRICWVIAGTFCGGEVHGSWAEKKLSCMSCSFFKQVRSEQGPAFVLHPDLEP